MRKILFGACAVFLSAASVTVPAVAQSALENNRTLCRDQWPGDYQMEEFCVKQQNAAYETVIEFMGSASRAGLTVYSNCQAEWIDGKGRADYEMIAFCVNEQMGARSRLGYGG